MTDEMNDNALPRDKADLMARIRREWAALEQAIAGMSEARLAAAEADSWAVKDHLAHLVTWEQWLLRYHLRGEPGYAVMGIDAKTMQTFDTDELNDIIYRRNRDRSGSEVLAELRESHAQVVAALDEMPFEAMLKQRYPDDPEARPVMAWIIGNTYEHYAEHAADIRALTAGR
jgi:uncharacterized protein (TIGR03083 family)